MRALTLAFVVLVGLSALMRTGTAQADDAASLSPSDRAGIERVIGQQLDAFRRDDGDAAFAFASPNIQSMFGTSEHFMEMVRTGYPPVYRPHAVSMGDLVTIEGRLVQKVALTGPDGRINIALYTMEREPDGSWRIDGCALTRGEAVGA